MEEEGCGGSTKGADEVPVRQDRLQHPTKGAASCVEGWLLLIRQKYLSWDDGAAYRMAGLSLHAFNPLNFMR
jgi:hypothetical protein